MWHDDLESEMLPQVAWFMVAPEHTLADVPWNPRWGFKYLDDKKEKHESHEVHMFLDISNLISGYGASKKEALEEAAKAMKIFSQTVLEALENHIKELKNV